MEEENKTGVGSIIGTIIIIAIIILGGLYFWGKRIEETKNLNSSLTEQQSATTQTQNENNEANVIKSSVGSTDDLDTLEADLKNTSTTGLNSELEVQAE